ncbi:MAG: PQQ-dependent sugar dehydrogenase [Gammaproteobacteria bacterium]
MNIKAEYLVYCCLIVSLAGCGGSGGSGNGSNTSSVQGLSARLSNSTCLAQPLVEGTGTVGLEDLFPDSPGFELATKMLQAPGDASRWFVLEKPGRVRVFSVTDPANVSSYLDISSDVTGGTSFNDERGLLGMAFHPGFPAVPEVFLAYTGGSLELRIARFRLDNTDNPVNPDEDIILRVAQPFNNHNGGDIAFGADGFLYIGLGDGGSGGDPAANGQNTRSLNGSMLRIDVQDYPAVGYDIPATNPFAVGNTKCGISEAGQQCPEIYAWGLRNPWRWSFDQATGQLWLGDVGQGSREEINLIEQGGNYGWNCREGSSSFSGGDCSSGGYTDPIVDYPRSDGQSVTGGFVYRGTQVPGLDGRYVFADYVSGLVWALESDGVGGFVREELFDAGFFVSAFALDQKGELYIMEYNSNANPGKMHRFRQVTPGGDFSMPNDLADTGCLNESAQIPYAINAPFWSDGAVKDRAMALPDGQQISIDETQDDDWLFPERSVLIKSFEVEGQKIETRLFMLHPDGLGGEWRGYSYEWDDTETSASLVAGGKSRLLSNGQTWIYPSGAECLQCHTAAANFALGLETAQMNRKFTYPSTGLEAEQLTTLDAIMVFDAPLSGSPQSLPRLPDPFVVSTGTLEDRARAYLHTNCSFCHRPGGGTTSNMDLRYTTDFVATATCDILPQGSNLGLVNPRIIDPGNAANSVLSLRINRRDSNGMPPVSSNEIDTNGVNLVNEWIASLSGC